MNLNDSNLTVPTEESGVTRTTETPLGTEFAQAEELGLDPLAGAAVGKRVNGGFILIAAVILSAVAGLFSMRKLAQVTAAAGIDTQVEATIEGFLDTLAGTGSDPIAGLDPARLAQEKDLIEVINSSYSEHQVPLEDVKRDPFLLEKEAAGATPTAPKLDPEAEAERLAREHQKRLDDTREKMVAAAEAMSLKSIVGGSKKMALIGNSIVREGETVTTKSGDITFRVMGITTSSVDLIAEDAELELTVSVTVYLDR